MPYTGSVVGQLEEAPEEEEEAAAPAAPAAAPEGADVLAMPSVRVLAKELGVDLATLRGTGPGGRILKQDVEDTAQAAAYGAAAPAAPVRTAPKAAPGPAARVRRLRPPRGRRPCAPKRSRSPRSWVAS